MAEWADFWSDEWGGAASTIETHEADAIDRLKFHLSGQPDVESLTGIFAERWQIIDNFLSDLLTLVGLDASFGDVQDKLGSLLNVPRQGFDDDDYRNLLRTKALILLRKRRTVEGLLELARSLLGPKTLSSVEPFVFDPDMSTLVDRVSASVGVATGTSYVAETDGRDFESSDGDLIAWASPPPFDLTGSPMSFAFRIKPESEGVTRYLLEIRGTGGGTNTLAIRFDGINRITFLLEHSGANLVRTTAVIPSFIGVERHVVVTHTGSLDAADVHIYLDGVELGYVTTTSGTGVAELLDLQWTLGSRFSAADGFDGEIRDVLAWNRALTGAEAVTVCQGGKRFIGFREIFPKAFELILEGVTETEESVFREFLRVARPATYNGTVLIVPDPAFGYDDSTAVFPTDVEGFDNASAPPEFGGPFSHVLVL